MYMSDFLLSLTFLIISLDPNWKLMIIPAICFFLAGVCGLCNSENINE